MKHIIALLFPLLLIAIPLFAQEEKNTGSIIVAFNNIEHDKGQIIASLHNTTEKKIFPAKDYKKTYKWLKIKIENKKAIMTFSNIPFGTYAISVFHDEDSNNKLNTNFIGIPNEGYGFSNNPKTLFGPPNFDKAKIELKADTLNIKIEIKY